MKTYKIVKKDVEELENICCDRCGRSCIGSCGNFCGVHLVISGNYDSPVFSDGDNEEYDICEACVSEWLKNWPQNFIYIGSGTNNTK